MTLSFKEVAEILKLIDASDCDEVVLELEGTKLIVRRRGNETEQSLAPAMPIARVETVPEANVQELPVKTDSRPNLELVPEPAPAEPVSSPEPENELVAEEGLVALRAPMVGTFYRRASPDDPAFVEVGTEVKAGDPLCLIEVMKLYTTIEAPEDGIVEQIAVDDGTLVEFNALLFLIRPK